MSEYNIQMNKYNALNAEYDQLYPATKIENVDGLDTALQNKAPAGYGLGQDYNHIADCHDTALKNGWYSLDGSGTINCPSLIQDSCYGVMFVQCRNSVRYHRVQYKGYVAQCSYDGSTWSQWEYINPPMLLGVEYRTTERYLGKPVYVKTVDFGALPNNGIKDVSAGISSDVLLYGFIDLAKSYFGPASVARTNFNPMHENIDQIWFRLGDIRIKTNIDMSGYVAYICVKYTKNTD